MSDRPAIRVLVMILSAAVGLSGLACAVLAGVQSPPLLFMSVLELCVVMCAVFGVLAARGQLKDGRALVLVCIGAGVIVATELGTRGAQVLTDGRIDRQLGSVSLFPLVYARFAVGLVFIALAALEVLARRPRESLRRLAWGAALGLPVIAAGAAMTLPATKRAFENLGGLAQLTLALGGFTLLIGLIAASAHYLITAFTVGVEAGERESSPT